MLGESFLENPAAHLPDLCQWLGIASDEQALNEMLHPERSPFASLGPRNAPFGTDPSFIRNPALRKFAPKPTSLEGPVAMPGDPLFSDELKQYARELGYS